MSFEPDIVVIGAGIAGTAIAAHLALHRKVQLFEMEPQPGYHSTGRSAALFSEVYGNETIRALTRASRAFFFTPPAGFADTPLVTPRRVLLTARPGQERTFDQFVAMAREASHIEPQSIEAAWGLCPILKREALAAAALTNSPADIDVHQLQQGYLRLFRHRGGVATMDSPVLGLDGGNEGWRVRTANGVTRAPVIVNAAGGWADSIARLAGAAPVGLQPLKRTVCVIEPPAGRNAADWPMLLNVEEEFYLKPDAGMLLLSPADETPTQPCDAQADELDIAIAVDRIEQTTTLEVRRIVRKWAGLRSFVRDRSPVVGFDRQQPGFFWLAALGGYGIQTAPALSAIAADLVLGRARGDDLRAIGIDLARMSPDRPSLRADEPLP